MALATPAPIVSSYPVSSTTFAITFPSIAAGYSGGITANGIVLTSAYTTLQAALSIGTPPMLSLAVLAPKPVSAYTGSNGSTPVVLCYAELTPTADLTVNGTVTVTFGFPAGTLSPSTTYLYALWFGQLSGVAWIDGNAVSTVNVATQTITIVATPNYDFRMGFIYGFAIYHN